MEPTFPLPPLQPEEERVTLPASGVQVDAEVTIHGTQEGQGRLEADVQTEASLDCKLSPGGNETPPTPGSPVDPKLGPDPPAARPPDSSPAEVTGSHGGHRQDGGRWERHSPSVYRARLGFHSLTPLQNGSSLPLERGRFPPWGGLSAQPSSPSSPTPGSGLVPAFEASHSYP